MKYYGKWLWQICQWVWMVCLLSGCTTLYLPQVTVGDVESEEAFPQRPLYVLASAIRQETGPSTNELVVVNPDTWQVAQRTLLPQGAPWNIDRDAQGRLWVGYATVPGQGDNRVLVLTPDGEIYKVLRLCGSPSYGIHFTNEYALVPCAMNGISLALSTVDLQTLDSVEVTDLSTPERFGLRASQIGNGTLLLYGSGETKNWLLLIEAHTRSIQGSIPIDFSSIRDVVYEGNQFYLLNIASYRFPEEAGPLLKLILPPSSELVEQDLIVKGPTWGFIADGQLYTYHNPTYGAAFDTSFRAIARLDLESDASEWWPLPDYWDAGDIAVVDSKIILTHARFNDPEQASGLYEFDPETGELTQLVHIPGASRIIPPSP